MEKIYCGLIKSDVRLLFKIKLEDGSVELIQVTEGSRESLKLLQLSEENLQLHERKFLPKTPDCGECVPYQLKKNELPQGAYVVGKDIPPGTYDLFVVYGHGGSLEFAKYDEDGKILDGTWNSYWVGLKEEYEHREVVHVLCAEGYSIKVKGNVILRIAKSNKVQIDL